MHLPPHACDCHTHLAGDPAGFPMAAGRGYTPPVATPKSLAAIHRRAGFERVVLVQASIYGTDNSATLDGLKFFGANARAVVVIDAATSEAELDAMHGLGVRGIRLNLTAGGQNQPALARRLFSEAASRVHKRGWMIQLFTNLEIIQALKPLIETSRTPVVIDHFGGSSAALGIAQPGFSDLLDLIAGGSACVKISCAYRISTAEPDYPDVEPLVHALVGANDEQVLWGSDWPHVDSDPRPGRAATDLAPNLEIDDSNLLQLLFRWVPDDSIRRKILVDNPARVFAF